jgi:5'-methylthioadenosine phosphorylase
MLAIIGGSGVYNLDGLTKTRRVKVESPFGQPSDEVLLGELDGEPLAFLPRHGRGHSISPSRINFRANIDALKRVGAKQVISISAVGSLRADLPPGMFVIVDQFIDRTIAREKTFFDSGVVAHVSLARPVCPRLGDRIEEAARGLGLKHTRGGTYLVMEGPQFSTLAESELYRTWGCDVIGMTNMPEAKLAREAELCYATVAMVTDYDCWHPDHDDVTVDMIIRTVAENAAKARQLVARVVPGSAVDLCPHGCHRVLDHAVITTREYRDAGAVERLAAIAGRVLQR